MNILPIDRLQRIARNVNAMEIQSNPRDHKYWRSVYARISRVTRQLDENNRAALLPMCDLQKAKCFNLV